MATRLTGPVLVSAAEIFSSSSNQEHDLGALAISADGRKYRYQLAGGTALVPGKLQQAPAEITNHQDLTATAASAIGDTTINVTLGATEATANQYAGGYLMVTTTPGQGYQYKIKSNPAADASAAIVITLADPIKVALTTSSVVDLVLSPYSGTLVLPTTASSAPTGVAVHPTVASEYGWIQTGGPACILANNAITVGVNVSASNGVAGSVEAAVTAQAAIGYAITGIADAEYGAIYLTID
ncbi:hypothetical protein CL633_04545 [bacterium]|jgi:hypothetical protein|nr:hypothetical protein [bacterium]|tara:strand:+ start:6247 stop:6969 length:723 start_codon:yes stop_codon:yes gene_type:complete